MKGRFILSLLSLGLLVTGCASTNNGGSNNNNNGQGQGEKTEYSKTEIVFGNEITVESGDYTAVTSLKVKDVELEFKKNNGSNDPVYYATSKDMRIYQFNTMKVTAKGMTKIDFLYNGDKSATIETDVGNYVSGQSTTGRWTGEADSVTFTIKTGQKRMLSLTVICGQDPNEDEKSPYPEDSSNNYTVDFEHLGLTQSLQNTQGNFKELMLGYLQKSRTEVSDISYDGSLQIYHKVQANNDEILALVVGSANYAGSLSISFSKELKKVKLYSSPSYGYKNVDGTLTPVVDGTCKITVNEEAWDLGQYDVSQGSVRTDKEFTINSNTLTLSGAANERVYTYAMTFYF